MMIRKPPGTTLADTMLGRNSNLARLRANPGANILGTARAPPGLSPAARSTEKASAPATNEGADVGSTNGNETDALLTAVLDNVPARVKSLLDDGVRVRDKHLRASAGRLSALTPLGECSLLAVRQLCSALCIGCMLGEGDAVRSFMCGGYYARFGFSGCLRECFRLTVEYERRNVAGIFFEYGPLAYRLKALLRDQKALDLIK
ncbi:hypothetical protein FQN54_008883 [Arachnomyces sp. PD_36]|nr:hypothetical protein FQN54_008883 [Arachnomyces sp. PD_36]